MIYYRGELYVYVSYWVYVGYCQVGEPLLTNAQLSTVSDISQMGEHTFKISQDFLYFHYSMCLETHSVVFFWNLAII